MKTNREKLFAIIVAAIAVVIVGYLLIAGSPASSPGEQGNRRPSGSDRKFQSAPALGRAASRKMGQYEERSLPANPEIR